MTDMRQKCFVVELHTSTILTLAFNPLLENFQFSVILVDEGCLSQILISMNRFGRKKTMVILLTAIILSGFANRFAPNYPAFLIGATSHLVSGISNLFFPGVFLCAFMSLAYGTVMYVWMMEHCDGEFPLHLP